MATARTRFVGKGQREWIKDSMGTMRRHNSLRHTGWNYAASGFYFVTICTYQRQCLFDRVEFRAVVEQQWQKIPAIKSTTSVRLDEWIVMPNHVHGIIVIVDGQSIDAPRPTKAVSGSIGSLVGTFKSSATKRINHKYGEYSSPIWQRGYYDKIIRNERQLNAIRQYIIDNPARWADDRDNLESLLKEMTYHPS